MQIGERLLKITSFVNQNAKVADIGTDHAKIPIYLTQKNIISYAIASDKNENPLQFAKENIRRFGVKKNIDIRLGDGLKSLKKGEVDTIIIAGMGGGLITKILSDAPNILKEISQLILQPMSEGNILRSWLMENKFLIEDEVLVKEDGKIYEIISAVHGNMKKLNDAELMFGNIILQNKNELLKERINSEIFKEKRKIIGMEKSQKAMNAKEYNFAKNKLKSLEELLW
ncbi:MAG: SAM-dependent methyltransferase [Selenomonadaceae bacterium]|nr:SAM-dependent methyltransferase [Selenomonadaceae bacterium]